MQAAKKLVLVDEFDREYKRLQRPTAAVAKTGRSLQLSDTLRDHSLADDRKVREYAAALHRYINTGTEVPPEPTVGVNRLTETRARVRAPPPPAPKQKKKKKKRLSWDQRGRGRRSFVWDKY